MPTKSAPPAARERNPQQRVTEGQVPVLARPDYIEITETERLKLNLWQKRARIINEIGNVPKRGYNAHHKYTYALEADVTAFLGPLLAKYMVVVDVSVILPSAPPLAMGDEPARNGVQRVELYKTGSGSTMWLTQLPLQITVVNADKPEERVNITWVGEGADTGDKALYKAYTGALKFFYMKWFMIATGDDPEAFERTDELAEGGGTRNVQVAASRQAQPEKGGRQNETTGVQVRSLGAMSRALHLGGEDQTARIQATAEYIDDVLKTSVRAGIGELEGDEAERAFKQMILALPGEDVGKVLSQMGTDTKAMATAEDADLPEIPGEGYGT